MATTEYKPGDTVPASGIYKVTHDDVHHDVHEVTCIVGNPFPPCNKCGDHPRFVLVHEAKHIEGHAHFIKTSFTSAS
jgi:hypothetical protein